jgi:DNA-binding LytR/AlgR family response regulator
MSLIEYGVISVPIQSGMVRIVIDQLAYAIIDDHYLHFYLINPLTQRIDPEPVRVRLSLNELMDGIPPDTLLRISRQVAVVRRWIRGYSHRHGLVLGCGSHKQLFVGDSYIEALRLTESWLPPLRQAKGTAKANAKGKGQAKGKK